MINLIKKQKAHRTAFEAFIQAARAATGNLACQNCTFWERGHGESGFCRLNKKCTLATGYCDQFEPA